MDDFELESDERVLSQGRAAMFRGRAKNDDWGPLTLTSQRILWRQQGRVVWPFKRGSMAVSLADVASLQETGRLDAVFGGRRLQIQLRSGKRIKLWTDPSPTYWIAEIGRLLG